MSKPGWSILVAAALLAACTQTPVLPDALNGSWTVQQIAGASLGEGVRVHMTIDARTGSVTGYTGCHDFSATMTSFGDAISIGAVQEQPGACATPAAATDQTRFMRVLGYIQRFIRHGRSLELLRNEAGDALLRLRADDANT